MVAHETVPGGRAGMAAYHAMFEHTCEGVLFSTPDGHVTAANPAASTLLGLRAEEICKLGMAGLVDHEDPRWGLALAERDRSGSWVGMLRFRRGDGRMVDIEATTRVFRDGEGAVQILSILHDVAGRLAIEREVEELSARLLQLSEGDELTGLHNRRGLLVAGNRLLHFADRQGAVVHALFADVENVQELNDRLGLHAGDAALQAVARALSVAFRKGDVLARIGGTQFLVLALDLSQSECSAITRRIEAHLAHPGTTEYVGAPVGVCLGWTTRQPADCVPLAELVARSDWAMLEAREARSAAQSRLSSPG
jgi:diguanylate cyclase (GGDEF)-like protein/PAS domain S-box-containing protein